MGSNKMYSSPTFLKNLENVPISTCMYPSKVFYDLPSNMKETYYGNEAPKVEPHLNNQNTSQMMTVASVDVGSVSQCQLDVIKNLKKLRDEIEVVQKSNNFGDLTAQGLNLPKSCGGGQTLDIVLSVNPASPPYFLLPIKRELQKYSRVMINSCVHSSIKKQEISDEVQKLFNDDESRTGRSNFDVVLTVIWKDVPKITMMVNPAKQVSIKGEVNVLRYLSRLLPPSSSLNYETPGDVCSTGDADYLLETIQSKLLGGNSKEKASCVKFLNSKLGGSAVSLEGRRRRDFGLCDIFAWSSIRQLRLHLLENQSSLPSNVSRWFESVDAFCSLLEK